MNNGFFNRVDNSFNKKNDGYRDYTLPFKFGHTKSEDGSPSIFHGAVLNGHVVKLLTHFVAGGRPALCNQMYGLKCAECAKPSSFAPKKGEKPSKNYPSKEMAFIAYVPELEGKVNDNDYPENPVKVISVNNGKDNVNFNALQDKIDGGEFVFDPEEPNLFRFKKTYGEKGSTLPPVVLSKKEFNSLEKALGKITVPAETFEKYGSKTVAEITSLILNNYGNVNWEFSDLVSAGVKNPNVAPDKAEGKPEQDFSNDDEDSEDEDSEDTFSLDDE